MSFESENHADSYWKENIRLMLILLAVWFVVSFGFGVILVDQLNAIRLGGFKLGFWFAQQGSIYTFLALIVVYVVQMNKLDRKYGVHEDGEEAETTARPLSEEYGQ